jgi:glucose-1-phosphate cytidylyltransferase
MKAVILAGGKGTRISEETLIKPKPMIEIGGKPILWHIMKIYSHYGINDFIICCGYKGYLIKEYFANYFLHTSDVTFHIKTNKMEVHERFADPWTVTLVDTGEETMTGGRLKKIEKYLDTDESFCFTYGDGLSDININHLINFHNSQNVLTTLTAVPSVGRFGMLDIKDNKVTNFIEKPKNETSMINGGFFVLSSKALKYIEDDNTVWEKEPLEILAKNSNLAAFKHDGFWYPMDTLRDKIYLDSLWATGNAPWKVWD